jgi:hypothetical protein
MQHPSSATTVPLRDVPSRPDASPVPIRLERLFDERARQAGTGGRAAVVAGEK